MKIQFAYLRALLSPRLRTVHLLFGLQALAVLVTLGAEALHLGHLRLHPGDLAGFGLSYAVLAGIVLFVLLARTTESEWTANLWRLVPLGDGTRFVTAQLATVLAATYFVLVQIIWLVPAAHFGGGSGFSTNVHVSGPVVVTLAFIALSALVWGWCFVSLVHLAGLALGTYLPTTREQFWRGFLYIGLFFLLGTTLDKLGDLLSLVLGPTMIAGLNFALGGSGNTLNFSGHWSALWAAAAYLWVLNLLMGGASAWLLAHRVETTENFA